MKLLRNIRAWWLRRWRQSHPMCSRCHSRVWSGPNHPPECLCFFLMSIGKL